MSIFYEIEFAKYILPYHDRFGVAAFAEKEEMFFCDLREGRGSGDEVVVFFHGHRAAAVFTFTEDAFMACFVDGQDVDVILLPQYGIRAPPFAELYRDEGQTMGFSLPPKVFRTDFFKNRAHVVRNAVHDFLGGFFFA